MFCLPSPWWPPGQYGASSCLMAASSASGFRCSPGHAALGNATCIASTPLHGHRNGLQWRCICLSTPPLSSDQIIAKRLWYGPFKVVPSYNINIIGVSSLFIYYSNDNRCHFGHHCCWWVSPISIKIEVDIHVSISTLIL